MIYKKKKIMFTVTNFMEPKPVPKKTSFSFITLFKTSDPPPRLTFDVLNLVILSLQAFSRRQPVFYEIMM